MVESDIKIWRERVKYKVLKVDEFNINMDQVETHDKRFGDAGPVDQGAVQLS